MEKFDLNEKTETTASDSATKVFTTCHGKIQSSGFCDTCGQMGGQTTTSLCGRLIEQEQKAPKEETEVLRKLVRSTLGRVYDRKFPTNREEKDIEYATKIMIEAMQEYSSTQRQQARKLVFENNKPVSDHVNETFEGLNKLTEDSEIVWWYKELIVQTVLHFTLQEREKSIEAVDNFIHGQIQSVKLWDAKDALIEHLKKLKTP